MIGLAHAQSYVTSTVGFDGSKYHYEYIVDASIDKRDIDTNTNGDFNPLDKAIEMPIWIPFYPIVSPPLVTDANP